MNNIILLSIQTKYANEIFNGNKKYEYRKSSIGTQNLNKKIFIYSAGIDKSIIGYIIIDKILEGNLDYIVKETNPKESNIKEYFKDRNKCYALHIKEIHKIESISLNKLKTIDKNIVLPQYYRYIKPKEKLYQLLKDF